MLHREADPHDARADGTLQGLNRFPLGLDDDYNIAICTDCCIGIPFDWIGGHMKDNHGLKCTERQVLECLNLMTRTMKSDEAQEWLSSHRIIRKPIDGVPVLRGFACSLCAYSGKKRRVLYNHISSVHKDENSKVTIVERQVQKPFQGRLKQYIQVEAGDESETEDENIDEWKLQLNEDFTRLMEENNQGGSTGNLDLKLINAFTAKIRFEPIHIFFTNIRWDVHLADVDTQSLVKLVEVPTIRDPWHRLIVCGRRYIKDCCKKLSGGNMIVRRALMIGK